MNHCCQGRLITTNLSLPHWQLIRTPKTKKRRERPPFRHRVFCLFVCVSTDLSHLAQGNRHSRCESRSALCIDFARSASLPSVMRAGPLPPSSTCAKYDGSKREDAAWRRLSGESPPFSRMAWHCCSNVAADRGSRDSRTAFVLLRRLLTVLISS